MLTYKSLNIGQPEHLSVLLSDYTPSRQLRSSDHQLLSQPTDNTVFAGCAFSSTAPRIWNSLPITIRTASTFRRHLKTAPTIRTSVLTYGALQMQTTYLLTYFSPATPPSTNCYHLRLRFELLFWHMARYKCRLLTYLLTFSPATPPSTNCYHLRLRFELLFWHMARYKCRLLTYLLIISGAS